VLPPFAEGVFVIKQTQLFDYIVHDEKGVNLRLVCHVLFVRLTQLADLVNIKALVWINLEHANNKTSQLLGISICKRRKIAFRDALE
jgi:hypothetical protein